MKHKIAIVVLAVLTSAAVAAVVAYKCPVCSGSGWKGNMKCMNCGGDGDA